MRRSDCVLGLFVAACAAAPAQPRDPEPPQAAPLQTEATLPDPRELDLDRTARAAI
jgi:hypothetical protein